MKDMMKIITRYIASAAGVALILLFLNLAVVSVWIWQAGNNTKNDYRYHISRIADSLTLQNGKWLMSRKGEKAFNERYQWAMLLDEKGAVIWSKKLPDDVPRKYTVSEVASFTHWYLNDYPVYVWHHPGGLFVLGSPRNSEWKMRIELPQKAMDNTLVWLPGIFIFNGIVAVLLATLFGVRLFQSLRPIAKGIEDIARKQPVALPSTGLLGNLSAKLNQASDQLQQQETALQKRDNARTAWIAGVSHDIRTPLSMVMGYASQLENNLDLPVHEREQAGIIRKQSERIKDLINDLNLTSKLEYDMQPIQTSLINPAGLVRSIVADFLNNGLGSNYSIEIYVKADTQSLIITGDKELLQRAVNNLMLNSIKHNPDGCIITVSLEVVPNFCLITVSDNGTGFAPEALAALKNPESPAKLQSHGLGLTIVRQILKAHGGTADFHNIPGEGCAAMLYLPLAYLS